MAEQCSFVELVADNHTKQRPKWFVSHLWGEPVAVQAMLDCLIQHAFNHCLPEDTPYWVCAYANNQHHQVSTLSNIIIIITIIVIIIKI